MLIALRAVEGRSTGCALGAAHRRRAAARRRRARAQQRRRARHAAGARRRHGAARRLSLAGRRRRLSRHAARRPTRCVTFDVDGVDKVDLKLERLGADGKAWVRADDAPAGQGETLPPARRARRCVRVSGARARHRLRRALSADGDGGAAGARRGARAQRRRRRRRRRGCPARPTMRGRLAPRGDEDWFTLHGDGGAGRRALRRPAAGERARSSTRARKVVPPGTPLVAGKRYFVVVKAASEKAVEPARAVHRDARPVAAAH